MLRVELDFPVLGVIEPGARAAVAASRSGRIGVIATGGTVLSGAYPRAVASLDSRAEVFARPAPLLVPLAEEGWTEGEVPRLVIDRYMSELASMGVDTVVLGCTHYPCPAAARKSGAAWWCEPRRGQSQPPSRELEECRGRASRGEAQGRRPQQ